MALSIKSGKLTGRVLAKAMAAALRQMQKSHNKAKPGRQSIKRLNRTIGGDTDNIEIKGRIKSFERIARKHDVGYRIEQNKSTGIYTVYFKTKQASDLDAAFKKYSQKMLTPTADKPSILSALRRMKELAKNQPDRVKNKERSGHEL